MNNLLLDTDIIIDVLRGYRKAIEFVKTLDNINISIFTALELIDGCEDKKSIEDINKLLDNVTIIEATTKCQNRGLELFKKYKLSSGLGLIDSVIAGISYEQGLILVTRNVKHFNSISDLKLFIPY